MYQDEWEELSCAVPLHSICAVMFLLVSFMGGMKGYEVVWTNQDKLRYDLT